MCQHVALVVSGVYLNDEGLVPKARGETQLTHVGCLHDEVFNAMEDSATSG